MPSKSSRRKSARASTSRNEVSENTPVLAIRSHDSQPIVDESGYPIGRAAGKAHEGSVLHPRTEAPRGAFAETRDAERAYGEMSIPLVSMQTYVIARCARWGTYVRWLQWSRVMVGRPRGVVSWWGKLVLDGNIEQIMLVREPAPVSVPEALETGNCIMALPAHLRDAVVEEHGAGGKQWEKAEALGIDVSTLLRRLDTAYPLLLELFNLAAAGLPLECNYRGPGRPRRPEE